MQIPAGREPVLKLKRERLPASLSPGGHRRRPEPDGNLRTPLRPAPAAPGPSSPWGSAFLNALPASTKQVAASCLLWSCRCSWAAWQKAFPAAATEESGRGLSGRHAFCKPHRRCPGRSPAWSPRDRKGRLGEPRTGRRPQPRDPAVAPGKPGTKGAELGDGAGRGRGEDGATEILPPNTPGLLPPSQSHFLPRLLCLCPRCGPWRGVTAGGVGQSAPHGEGHGCGAGGIQGLLHPGASRPGRETGRGHEDPEGVGRSVHGQGQWTPHTQSPACPALGALSPSTGPTPFCSRVSSPGAGAVLAGASQPPPAQF